MSFSESAYKMARKHQMKNFLFTRDVVEESNMKRNSCYTGNNRYWNKIGPEFKVSIIALVKANMFSICLTQLFQFYWHHIVKNVRNIFPCLSNFVASPFISHSHIIIFVHHDG